jgi:hypothetical protein
MLKAVNIPSVSPPGILHTVNVDVCLLIQLLSRSLPILPHGQFMGETSSLVLAKLPSGDVCLE